MFVCLYWACSADLLVDELTSKWNLHDRSSNALTFGTTSQTSRSSSKRQVTLSSVIVNIWSYMSKHVITKCIVYQCPAMIVQYLHWKRKITVMTHNHNTNAKPRNICMKHPQWHPKSAGKIRIKKWWDTFHQKRHSLSTKKTCPCHAWGKCWSLNQPNIIEEI